MRVCSTAGCPTIYPKTEGSHCPTHRAHANRKRGSRQQRGYDSAHDRLRKQWAPVVARGKTNCWRCGKPITATESWHLGHNDEHTRHQGPEHVQCNLSAAGTKSHTHQAS